MSFDSSTTASGRKPGEGDHSNLIEGGKRRSDPSGKPGKNAGHAKSSGVSGVSGVKPVDTGIPETPPSSGASGVSGVKLPPGFSLDARGLWHKPDDPDCEPQWICSPLRVTALARSDQGNDWGRVLEWHDPDGNARSWACPMEMFAGDGTEFRRVLLRMGLEIAPVRKAHGLLNSYVQAARVSRRAVCTERTGWHRGQFVLPDETIGDGDEKVLLQFSDEPPKMGRAGTAGDWRDSVGQMCVGNSRLIFAASSAFAAPLLDIAGQESGGVHLVGDSSTGKTTALKCAASVWGGPDFLHRWRATTNGLEAVAQGHNDCLLVLDELAQVDSREAGECAYMLANGSGKHRARRDGLAKKAANWRLLFLSAGEIGLAEHMAESGKRSRAGQEVRLADVPADTGVYGLFENLHGSKTASIFADRVGHAAATTYGAPIRDFLKAVTDRPRAELKARIDRLVSDFAGEALPGDANGQARRVCARFGLIAAGGELATDFGLTGWERGDAFNAASDCFAAWLDRRGGAGSQEQARAIAQVRHFLENHGDARFSNPDSARPIPNRAGYRRVVANQVQYLILPETFKREVCAGMDYRLVARALRDQGLLVTEGRHHTIKRHGIGRVYGIREAIGDCDPTDPTDPTATPLNQSRQKARHDGDYPTDPTDPTENNDVRVVPGETPDADARQGSGAAPSQHQGTENGGNCASTDEWLGEYDNAPGRPERQGHRLNGAGRKFPHIGPRR